MLGSVPRSAETTLRRNLSPEPRIAGRARREYRLVVPDLQEVIMRVVAGFGVFILLGGLSALAQSAPQPDAGLLPPDGALICTTELLPDKDGKDGKVVTATVCKSTMVTACPLAMHVRQRAGGELLETDAQGKRVPKFVPRLTLELEDTRPDRSSQRMLSATLTVHGWNPRGRTVPLDSDGAGKDDLVRRMTVPLTGGGLPEASADLYLPGFTVARMVRLESITFDDGDVWSFHSCQAAPDLYLPVAHSN
jgi:hypothetical protein